MIGMTARWCVTAMPALLLVAGIAGAAGNGVYTTVTPTPRFDAEKYPGSQFRTQVDGINAVAGGTLAIMEQLQPALEFCDARIAGKDTVHVSVSTRDEARAFAASQPPGAKIDYIDIACPRAWFAAAFASTDAGDPSRSIALLERVQMLAPYWADPFTERGFLFNAAGDRAHALASYRHALELAELWPSSRSATGTALRGIGYTLVELGDYDGARKAYQQSLAFDPDNAIAVSELKFIEKNHDKGSPNTTIFDTKLSQDEKSLAWRQFALNTKQLEKAPLADDTPALRSEMIKQLEESKDITVKACDVLALGDGNAHAEPELLVQYLFGNAAFQIERTDMKDDLVAVQVAGARSALRAYRAMIADHPQLKLESMDRLLQHEDAGDLEQTLEPVIRKNCSHATDSTKGSESRTPNPK